MKTLEFSADAFAVLCELEVSICEVPAAGPKEDMLETILAEHNNLPEKMKQELASGKGTFSQADFEE